jgi:hypothetical protein
MCIDTVGSQVAVTREEMFLEINEIGIRMSLKALAFPNRKETIILRRVTKYLSSQKLPVP